MGYEIVRLPFDGAVDADGHVLEPADVWETYLEERYRDRAIRLRVDDDGLEYFEFDGSPSVSHAKGKPGLLGAMGDTDAQPSPDRRYMESMPYGACDPKERVDLLDQENLDHALLYPTVGLLWEGQVIDPEITVAYTRAYNRWIADFCRDSNGRLVAIAHLSLIDPDAAAVELKRAVDDGCKGAFVAGFTHSRKPHGHPDHDVVWAKAAELDVPVGIHPVVPPLDRAFRLFKDTSGSVYSRALAGDLTTKAAFLSFFDYAVFDTFPTLKIGVLESQSGWIGTLLDRLEAVHDTLKDSSIGTAPLKESPSTYFRRQCFISGDPDETAAPLIMDHVGANCFMWATDYPHMDHPASWAEGLQRMVAPLSDETRQRVVGGNTKELYRLG